MSDSGAPLAADRERNGWDAERRRRTLRNDLAASPPRMANPVLRGLREGVDHLTCRTCGACEVVLASEAPWALVRDLGLCADDGLSPVDPDEPRRGADAECWRPRPW